jgi:glycosyltransferase involved in cell wall biosynthesis
LDQNDCSIEVIVVDDGSNDNTKGVLSETFRTVFHDNASDSPEKIPPGHTNKTFSFGDSFQIHYHYQKNQGACVARNTGISVSKGRYVKFLDSDDELIPGSLVKEMAYANETNADVVVTGWQEKTYDVDRSICVITKHIPAPDLERGLDDMLLGRSFCTSAALYRREFVAKLEWDSSVQKAQDWAWAWTVCFAGATFKKLDIESSIYSRYSGKRITSEGDPFLRSTENRQRILRMAEDRMREHGQLTKDRCCALVQYYYKDSKVLCDLDPQKWRRLWLHCKKIAPGFSPVEHNRIIRPFVNCLGPYWGVCLYVKLRKVVRLLGIKQIPIP